LRLLSRGRWSDAEQEIMVKWLRWILGGVAFYLSVILVGCWLQVRVSLREVFVRLYLPWLGISAGAYAFEARAGGPTATAQANVLVGATYMILSVALALKYMNRKQASDAMA
jgi:hypothetical protein